MSEDSLGFPKLFSYPSWLISSASHPYLLYLSQIAIAMASLAKDNHAHSYPQPQKTRSKSGCLTCRYRRKKCDERKPNCSSCARSEVKCDWPSFHVIEASSTTARDFFGKRKVRETKKPLSIANRYRNSTNSSDAVGTQPCPEHIFGLIPAAVTTIYSEHQALSWQLLEFFVLEGSKGMSGRAPSNDPFVQLVLQLSQSDRLIWSALLAFSGSRMSLVCPLPTIEWATLNHYNDTLVHLQAALGHWPPKNGEEVIRLLSASILLCHKEVCHISILAAATRHLTIGDSLC